MNESYWVCWVFGSGQSLQQATLTELSDCFFLSLQAPWAAFSCGARSICWHAAVGPAPLLSSPVSVLCLISDASAPLSAWAAGSLMLSTANYGCNAKELILRSALHGSIHNHSWLFRTGKRGGLLLKSPWGTPRAPCSPLFCMSRCRLLAAQICRANKHLVFCHNKITIRKHWLLLKEKWWITSQRSVT